MYNVKVFVTQDGRTRLIIYIDPYNTHTDQKEGGGVLDVHYQTLGLHSHKVKCI